MNKGLKYIGKGDAVIGIPARDLSAEEVKHFGGVDFLISTGLYRADEPEKKPAKEK
jgi:hypothetical protein